MSTISQVCGIVTITILLIFFRYQKKLQLHTQQAFLYVAYTSLICLYMDILSIIVLNRKDILPPLVVELVSKLYPVMLPTVVVFAIIYACSDIYSQYKDFLRIRRRYLILAIITAIILFILPIEYHTNENDIVLYTEGPCIYATYISVSIYICLLMYNTVIRGKSMNRKRLFSIWIWISVWVSAAIIQLFNNEVLIVSYASSLGIMIIYLALENPEANIDRRTGLFNHNALLQYTKQLYGDEKQFSVLCLLFTSPYTQELRIHTHEPVYIELVHYLESLKQPSIFKNTDGELFLIFHSFEDAENTRQMIDTRFSQGFGKEHATMLRYSWILVPDATIVSSEDELLSYIRYICQTRITESTSYVLDANVLNEILDEQATEQMLISAIKRDAVEVFYQPIYATKESKFTSAEALVRIRDEEGNLVPPGKFIPIAEKNGMILKLGTIVFEKICHFLNDYDIESLGLQYIEVNLSVVQCAYEHLAEDYIRIMNRYHTNPRQINLEITESASLSAKKTLLHNMHTLIDYGIDFSLDDFGTGQSNLNYIIDMPVSIVKFDRQMTQSYFENEKARHVMNAAMNMIQNMKLAIVSEGIEDKESFETMKNLNIDFIQGYYFSKPLPTDEFLTFLKEHAE